MRPGLVGRLYRLVVWPYRLVVNPGDTLSFLLGRLLCRVFHYHGLTCRPRKDHRPLSSVPGRWQNQHARSRV
ncbi:hypothetical protein AB0O28_18850 [Microbispora sp. NPDC088329]|uniref:hypothetical protein n=1 Tax=Microbispora sp. NPDC088329 TaxID=3154869 RepID=UPI003433CDF2